MSKVKPKKHNVFIDMTAMSDVTVLLLTFFMSTSTFLPKEPVKILAPASVSEIKIPEKDVMTLKVDPTGKVYMNLDRKSDKMEVLKKIGKDYNFTFTPKQIKSFIDQPNIGMPIGVLPKFLDMDVQDQDKALKEFGIPTDSTNNQLRRWVSCATSVNKDLAIAIKADANTPYPKIKTVMNTLRDLKLNRYSLITTLKPMPVGF